MNRLDLDRLATRIETLERTSTHGWMPGDDLDFRHRLPVDRIREPRRLPMASLVRDAAWAAASGQEFPKFTEQNYRDAIQVCLHLEGLIARNRPNNPRRMMHDMARGRMPGFRR